jgi:hypothetical protein
VRMARMCQDHRPGLTGVQQARHVMHQYTGSTGEPRDCGATWGLLAQDANLSH